MATRQTLTEAFRRFGASLANPKWSVSSVSPQGELVVSCWNLPELLFTKGDALVYRDRISRWPGSTGNRKLQEHLIQGWEQKLPVRLVQATPDDVSIARNVIANGEDASVLRKHFHAREDVIGQFAEFDGDLFVFEFRRAIRGT